MLTRITSCLAAFSVAANFAYADNLDANPDAPSYDDYSEWSTITDSDYSDEEKLRTYILKLLEADEILKPNFSDIYSALGIGSQILKNVNSVAWQLNTFTPQELSKKHGIAATHFIAFKDEFEKIFSDPDFRTNCYAYAVNDVHGEDAYIGGLPNPGQYAGHLVKPETIYKDAFEGAVLDGLIPAGEKLPELKDGYYRVALMIRGGDNSDYHWIRENKNGIWSGKTGHTAPMNTDRDGKIITNPMEANFNGYVIKQFFYVIEGGIDIQNPVAIQRNVP